MADLHCRNKHPLFHILEWQRVIAPASPKQPKEGYYCAYFCKKQFISSRSPPLVWVTEWDLTHHCYLPIYWFPLHSCCFAVTLHRTTEFCDHFCISCIKSYPQMSQRPKTTLQTLYHCYLQTWAASVHTRVKRLIFFVSISCTRPSPSSFSWFTSYLLWFLQNFCLFWRRFLYFWGCPCFWWYEITSVSITTGLFSQISQLLQLRHFCKWHESLA